jgi:hypothetical protein
MVSLSLISLFTLIPSLAPAATSCSNNFLYSLLKSYADEAVPLCSEVSTSTTTSSLPSWLRQFKPAITDVNDACQCFLSTARVKPASGAVCVSKDGRNGCYTTVEDGVNALSVNQTGDQALFIYPGAYFEQVVCVFFP